MKSTLIVASLFAVALSAPTTSPNIRRAANLQTFSGALGGIAPTPVLDSGDAKRPFSVKGDTFVNIAAALQRSCDQQFNACANKANGGDKTLSVSACSDQKTQCDASGSAAPVAAPEPAQDNAQSSGNVGAGDNADGTANANPACTLVQKKRGNKA